MSARLIGGLPPMALKVGTPPWRLDEQNETERADAIAKVEKLLATVLVELKVCPCWRGHFPIFSQLAALADLWPDVDSGWDALRWWAEVDRTMRSELVMSTARHSKDCAGNLAKPAPATLDQALGLDDEGGK